MTTSEKESLIKQIDDYRTWMRDSSGYDWKGTSIADLVECDDDIYEVFVVVHLISGERITLRNNCYQSFMRKCYCGDTLFYNGDEEQSVEINYKDVYDNDILHQCQLPISSICYIEGYSIRLNWLNLSKLKI